MSSCIQNRCNRLAHGSASVVFTRNYFLFLLIYISSFGISREVLFPLPKFLHNLLLSRNVSNFALSRVVDEIAKIHWVSLPKFLYLLFEVLDTLGSISGCYGTGVTSASVVQIQQWLKRLQIVSSVTSML